MGHKYFDIACESFRHGVDHNLTVAQTHAEYERLLGTVKANKQQEATWQKAFHAIQDEIYSVRV